MKLFKFEFSMKKIVIISYNIYPYLYRPELKISGGAELQIAILAKLLSEKGFQIFFFTGDFGQSEVVEIDGYTFIRLVEIQSGPLKKIKNFIKYIGRIKPFIVLERGTSPFSFLAAILSRLLGNQYVFCAASDVNFAKKENDPAFSGNRIKQRLYQWSLPLVAHFIVQKNSQAVLLKKNFDIEKNVTLIRNFPPEIDSIKIDAGKTAIEYEAVWLANLIPYKQPELFIELARRNPSCRFLLIGASQDEQYNEKIMKKVADVKNLTATGYVRHSEVVNWLRKCKIVVNTTNVSSGYEEGFSNVQIMGWICGKPSLTLISDPDSLIVQNQMGFCSGNFEQLCVDFKKLAENNELYARMSKNARNYAIQNHDMEKILQQYLKVFGNSKIMSVSASTVAVE